MKGIGLSGCARGGTSVDALGHGREGGRCSDDGVDRAVRRLGHHWLAIVTSGNATILAGSVAVAFLRAHGATALAEQLSRAYLLLCPQRPAHSYFPFGAQMALEEREVAMFATLVVGGIVYGVIRHRIRAPRLWLVLALSVPMAWDIGSQMLGIRDSGWLWRSWTAVLSTSGAIWFVYPLADLELRRREETS